MKRFIYALTIAAALVFVPLAVFAAECTEHAGVPALRTAGTATDPVSGKEVPTSNAKFAHEYKGTKYYFCNEENLREFKASPEKYVSPYKSPSACPGKEEHAKNPDLRTGNVAIDPVCGMKVKTRGAKYVYEYKGKKYYFCEKENLEKFRKDPGKYVK